MFIVGYVDCTPSQTRPDMRYEACNVITSVKNKIINDLTNGNESIHNLKGSRVLLLHYCSLENLKRWTQVLHKVLALYIILVKKCKKNC